MAKHSYHYWLWRYMWIRAKRRSLYKRRYGLSELDWHHPATWAAAFLTCSVVLGLALGSVGTGFLMTSLVVVVFILLILFLRFFREDVQSDSHTRYQVELFAEKLHLGLQRHQVAVQYVGPEEQHSTLVSVRDNGIVWMVGNQMHGIPYRAIQDMQASGSELRITAETKDGVAQYTFRGERIGHLETELRSRIPAE
jgi:hypothetical protein